MTAPAPTRPTAPAVDTHGGSGRRGPSSAAARDGRRGWLAVTLVVALAVLVPVGLVVSSVVTPSRDVWAMLWRTELPEMLLTTVGLMLGVVFGALVMGGGLAWLVGRYRFPGQRAFSWLLVLPLAVPAYVLGFVYLGILDHPGPVQTTLRGWFGDDVWFPQMRSFPVAVAVMVLALYPYVYLLARAALREQSATTYEAARMLGHGPLAAAWRVVLPMARPSLAAGAALVAMETLTDYATVQYFNVTTVSVGIDKVWNGMYDRGAATELASLVLLFAVAVIAVERIARGRARYTQDGGSARPIEPVRLHGWRAWTATGLCVVVVGVTFVVPVVQLLAWTTVTGIDARFTAHLGNSLLLAAVVAVICAILGVAVASATRFSGDGVTRGLARLATIGYAVPGPVVAVGVLLMAAAGDALLDLLGVPGGGLLLTGSVGALIYAYVVRFLALGYNSVDASLEKVTPSMTAAALTLGAPPRTVMRRVHLPLIRSGVGVALVLVAVDALKELPVVLLLRPFGFETLAVWVYQLASESRWAQAGLPALTIVLVALVPVVLLFRRTLNPKENAR
ncbi:MAG: ABC transporter permease [Jiangellaceae bacterium]